MPKRVDHDVYRAELVQGCIELFASKGYGVTMREAAKGLGVSTGTLYHYFPNKQAIFAAVVEAVTQLDAAFGQTLLALDPTERLFAMHRYVAENEDRFAQHLLIILEVLRVEGPDSEIMRSIRLASRGYVSTISALLEIDDDATRQLLAVTNGHLFRRLFDGRDGKSLEELMAEGHARMLFGRTS